MGGFQAAVSFSAWSVNGCAPRQAYAKKHAEVRAGQQKMRAVVYVCSGSLQCGGWGDRLKGILYSFIVGLLTDRMIFIQYDKGGGNLTDVYGSNRVDWLVDQRVVPAGGRTHDPSRSIDMLWCASLVA